MTDLTLSPRVRLAATLIASIAVAALAAGIVFNLRPSAQDFTLAAVEADVTNRFPEVAQMKGDGLAVGLQAGKTTLIFDVREEAEYRVSHLDGAQRVDPGIAPDAFIARYGAQAVGRDAVFYCSVGMRSSSLAAEVQDALVKAGATGVYNLSGGIFAWHNAGRPLVDASGATDFVHPYNAKWGTLVVRQDKVRTDATP